jgi:xylan 1,4-beta-xylosidase
MIYRNPVLPGFHPDPSVTRVGEDFYLVTSSFEFFPGVPIFHSRDLAHWRQIGFCLTRKSQLNLDGVPNSGGIYAPTIRWHDGRFYMVTTNVNHGGNFFVWTEDPAGEWSEPISLPGGGIDPSLTFDGDKVWLTGCGAGDLAGIVLTPIDIGTGKPLGESRVVWKGTGGAFPEGPHLYGIGGLWYLMISEGGTEHGHMVTIARAERPEGPFVPCPRNPVLTNRSLPLPVKAAGHADLFEDSAGRWWAVCLGIRPVPYPWRHHLGRETFLVPVVWDADGWPVFGNAGTVGLEMEGDLPGSPSLVAPNHARSGADSGEAPDPLAFRDDFDSGTLGFDWSFIRNPDPGCWSLGDRKGSLRLRGTDVTLDDVGSPAFVGRRQEHFNVEAATLLDFDPKAEGEEAGLAVYLNEEFHYEVSVVLAGGKRLIAFRRRLGSLWKREASIPIPSGPVILRVDADQTEYRFSFRMAASCRTGSPADDPDRTGFVDIGRGECRYLSSEVGGKFTGVFLGLYACGEGRASGTDAFFDWFEYRTDRIQWSLEGAL